MQSVLEILNKCEEYFAQKGVPTPKLDAQLLLAHALGCKRLELFLKFDKPLEEKELAPFRDMVKRRAKREPLQHILADSEFFGIKLKSDKRALVPRQETEELCEIVGEQIAPDISRELDILDLGTGSGTIALALATHYPNSKVVAADFSEAALELTRENLDFLKTQSEKFSDIASRVKIIKSDWFENIVGEFDIIAANPPYLTQAEYDCAQPEVKQFDPINALVAQDDGFADLRKIIATAPKFLKDGGTLVCECGIKQPQKLVEEFGSLYTAAQAVNDSSHRPRFVIFKK